MDFLHQLGVIHPLPEHDEAAPIERAVQAFATYLRVRSGRFDIATLIQYCPFIGRFLPERFRSTPFRSLPLCWPMLPRLSSDRLHS
ncbi:MAG: hypothetical protein IPN78_19175 [Candidatus Accumulibacter sp.]|nr:hypothetical protein [Candidatus Accumulibacter propinquus]